MYSNVMYSCHKGLSVKGLAVGKGTGMLCCGHSSGKVGSSGSSGSFVLLGLCFCGRRHGVRTPGYVEHAMYCNVS
jgi:hypothetical protein